MRQGGAIRPGALRNPAGLHRSAVLPAVALLLAAAGPSPADAVADALRGWMADFNDRRADRVCDLFAPDLVSDYQGIPEQGFATLCAGLRQSLADPQRSIHYALDLKEVQVEGDMAIARVVWTYSVTSDGPVKTVTGQDIGLDVFRRQADGSWKIVRFLAYPALP